MDLVPYAVPFFLAAILSEFAWGYWRGRNTYRLNDSINSLSLGVLSVATKLLGLNLAGSAFDFVGAELALFRLDPAAVPTWLFALLAYDFCYYWFHRISHERTLFWAAHVVHHQSEEFNLSTALRQTSTGFLLAWVFYLPCFLLGVPAEVFITIASAHLIYQFWVHSRHIPKLGFLEWFLVTASNHRVHHARNPCYVDTNYGGLLIIWDRLFGTFREERDDEPCVYGITTPLRSWNPVWANLHIYAGMLRDAMTAGSPGTALRVLWSRTGWHPVGAPSPSSPECGTFERYDPHCGQGLQRYAGLQFLLAMAFSLWMERAAPEVGAGVQWILVAYLVLWLVAIGCLIQNSPHGPRVEQIRCMLTLGLLPLSGATLPIWLAVLAYVGVCLLVVRVVAQQAGGRVELVHGLEG